jgi:hypothetical protein
VSSKAGIARNLCLISEVGAQINKVSEAIAGWGAAQVLDAAVRSWGALLASVMLLIGVLLVVVRTLPALGQVFASDAFF